MFKNSALVVVDAECGFSELCPDELPVPDALGIVPVINKLLTYPWKYKFASLDYHPYNHCSFKEFGGPFNTHCERGKKGSEFLPGLHHEEFNAIFRKGWHPNKDSLSLLTDHPYLKQLHGLDTICLAGICKNICVVLTGMDFSSFVPHSDIIIIEDACATLPLPADNPYCPEVIKKKALSCAIKYLTSADLETQWKL